MSSTRNTDCTSARNSALLHAHTYELVIIIIIIIIIIIHSGRGVNISSRPTRSTTVNFCTYEYVDPVNPFHTNNFPTVSLD